MESKKSVFVSYGREPEVSAFVKKLKADLEQCGVRVWLDCEDIPAGSEWPQEIGLALRECTAIIPVITTKYTSSRYCKAELYVAQDHSKKIFPVIYDDLEAWKTSKEGAGVEYMVAPYNWSMFRPDKDDYDKSLSKLVEALREVCGYSEDHGSVAPTTTTSEHSQGEGSEVEKDGGRKGQSESEAVDDPCTEMMDIHDISNNTDITEMDETSTEGTPLIIHRVQHPDSSLQVEGAPPARLTIDYSEPRSRSATPPPSLVTVTTPSPEVLRKNNPVATEVSNVSFKPGLRREKSRSESNLAIPLDSLHTASMVEFDTVEASEQCHTLNTDCKTGSETNLISLDYLQSAMSGYSSDSNIASQDRGRSLGQTSDCRSRENSPAPMSIDAKPTIAKLQSLKLKDGVSKLEIIRAVAPKWRQFACHLDFDEDGYTIDNIEAAKRRQGPVGCCTEMFKLWLRGEGTQPASWELLIQLLKDNKLKTLALKVERFFAQ